MNTDESRATAQPATTAPPVTLDPHRHPRRPCDRARLRLAARRHRLRRRRRIGAGAGAVQCLADSVPDLSGAGLAGRRLDAGRWSGVWAAAVAGWCFGFGYFLVGLYWIGYAFLVDAKTFGWLLPVAVAGLPAYLAIYTALGLGAARLIWVRGPERILALAAALTIAEWLRGHLLTGFPWNTFGYALTEPLPLAQSVSLVGIWGLTFLAVAIFASPAVLADDKADTPRPCRAPLIGLASSPPSPATVRCGLRRIRPTM